MTKPTWTSAMAASSSVSELTSNTDSKSPGGCAAFSIAKLAVESPPPCLDDFKHRLVTPAEPERLLEEINFDIICPRCDGEQFQVGSYSKNVRGQDVQIPPHRLKCTQCEYLAVLLNPNLHGYDASIGEGPTTHMGAPASDNEVFSVSCAVRLWIVFNDSEGLKDELLGIAAGSKHPVANLFDAAAIIGVTNGQEVLNYNFELA